MGVLAHRSLARERMEYYVRKRNVAIRSIEFFLYNNFTIVRHARNAISINRFLFWQKQKYIVMKQIELPRYPSRLRRF